MVDETRAVDEPWKRINENGSVREVADGYVAKHRSQIKNRANAPHLAVIMPIGDKEEQHIHVDEHGERSIVGEYRQPGLVPIELMVNQMQLAQPLNVSVTWLVKKNDLSAVLREAMTKEAMALGVNFVFYWDDDVLVPSNTLYRMLAHMSKYPDIGLVTGVVWTRADPPEPILYKDGSVGAYWGFDTNPEAPPEDIYACGAGCMLVRMAAIRRMESPWWTDIRKSNESGSVQSVVGHDIGFVSRLREETGYRTTVDGSIQCHHFDVQKQRIFSMPDDMPNMTDARDQSDDHADVDRSAGQAKERTGEEILEALAHDVS